MACDIDDDSCDDESDNSVDENGCRSAGEFPQPGFHGLRELLRDFKNTS